MQLKDLSIFIIELSGMRFKYIIYLLSLPYAIHTVYGRQTHSCLPYTDPAEIIQHYSDTSDTDTSMYIEDNPDYNLILAAYHGYESEIIRLLNNGADINATTWEGVTPLMFAVESGHNNIVEILMLNGADPDRVPENGITALIAAVEKDNFDVAENLIRMGADIDLPGYDGVTPLMISVKNNNEIMCDMLLYYDADPDIKDRSGTSALMVAAFLGYPVVAGLLTDRGADINIVDNEGYTALHYAAQNGFPDIVEMLIAAGADITVSNKYGYTPLAIAAQNGYNDIVTSLVRSGADVNKQITPSLNPIDIAIMNKNDSTADYLKRYGARKNFMPSPGYFSFGGDVSWNMDDFMSGLNLGIFDTKYNFSFTAGYLGRPFAVRVLENIDTLTSYQYWEKRGMVYAGLQKNISLISFTNTGFAGLSLGVKTSVTWAKYRGASHKPDRRIYLVPFGGAFFSVNKLYFQLLYEYNNLDVIEIHPGRIHLTVSYRLINKRSTHFTKEIPWL